MEYTAVTWHLDEFWGVEFVCVVKKFKSSKLSAHLWQHVVHLGQKYPQN